MMKPNRILSSIYEADPRRRRVEKRFVGGTIISVAAGYAVVDVGAKLPLGADIYLTLPVASGFNPQVGQNVSILYSTQSLASGYVAAASNAVPATAPIGAPDPSGTIGFYVASVGASALFDMLQAAGLNATNADLYLLGVSIFAVGATGTTPPEVDVYLDSTSLLSEPQQITAGTVHTPSPAITVLAGDGTLSVRCATADDGSIDGLTVTLWCGT